jgi:hypothetical protein
VIRGEAIVDRNVAREGHGVFDEIYVKHISLISFG